MGTLLQLPVSDSRTLCQQLCTPWTILKQNGSAQWLSTQLWTPHFFEYIGLNTLETSRLKQQKCRKNKEMRNTVWILKLRYARCFSRTDQGRAWYKWQPWLPIRLQQKICRMVLQLLLRMSELFWEQTPPQYVLCHCMIGIYIKKNLFSHPILQIPHDWFQKSILVLLSYQLEEKEEDTRSWHFSILAIPSHGSSQMCCNGTICIYILTSGAIIPLKEAGTGYFQSTNILFQVP